MKRRLLSTITLLTLACQSGERDIRPWRSSDHDRGELPNGASASGEQPEVETATAEVPLAASPHARGGSLGGRAMQVWIDQCMRCHGQIGAGDGPDGVSVRATSFADGRWKAGARDAAIAETIRKGKGAMPSFNLDPDVVGELVTLIRRMAGTDIGADTAPPLMPSEGASQK